MYKVDEIEILWTKNSVIKMQGEEKENKVMKKKEKKKNPLI